MLPRPPAVLHRCLPRWRRQVRTGVGRRPHRPPCCRPHWVPHRHRAARRRDQLLPPRLPLAVRCVVVVVTLVALQEWLELGGRRRRPPCDTRCLPAVAARCQLRCRPPAPCGAGVVAARAATRAPARFTAAAWRWRRRRACLFPPRAWRPTRRGTMPSSRWRAPAVVALVHPRRWMSAASACAAATPSLWRPWLPCRSPPCRPGVYCICCRIIEQCISITLRMARLLFVSYVAGGEQQQIRVRARVLQ